jgi:phospholipid/cholesterol/gamma-HCH transport system permease protein
VGRVSRTVSSHSGQIGLLVWQVGISIVRLRVAPREIVRQVYIMGIQSVPIVMVTAILAGTVMAQQGGYQFTGSIPTYIMGSVVVENIVLEMGPVLTALVLVGRIGARITAELGTMQVSEQMDAMYSVGRDPVEILAAPRVIGGMIALPLLVGLANLLGVMAGMFVAGLTLDLSYDLFFYGARLFWHSWDMFYSLMKAVAFGFAIPVISIHMGLRTTGGAAGVGLTTTRSVMFMTLTILIVDALFPPLFLQ